MDKKVKIVLACITMLILIGVAIFIGMNYSDKSGEGATIQKIKDDNGKVVETIRYSDVYQQNLDAMYENVINENTIDVNALEIDVQKLVHWMANPVIKAKANRKVGFIKPDPENIGKLITIIEKTKPRSNEFYITTLKKWSKGDFVDTKEVHNKAWEYLNGDVGEAKSPDDERIKQIKADYFTQ